MAKTNPVQKQYIISLRGPLGAGKSTIAEVIKEFGEQAGIKAPVRAAFADALKIEVYNVLLDATNPYWAVAKKDGIYLTSFPSNKPSISRFADIEWVNQHKKYLRPLLQHYGTEYRRASDPEYWVKKMKERVKSLISNACSVIVDDARFPNERSMLKKLGAVEVFIVSPNAAERAAQRDGVKDPSGIKNHESEKYNDPKDPDIDYLFLNDCDPENLGTRIGNLMQLIVENDASITPVK